VCVGVSINLMCVRVRRSYYYSAKAGGVMRSLRSVVRSVCLSVNRITQESVNGRQPNYGRLEQQMTL